MFDRRTILPFLFFPMNEFKLYIGDIVLTKEGHRSPIQHIDTQKGIVYVGNTPEETTPYALRVLQHSLGRGMGLIMAGKKELQ